MNLGKLHQDVMDPTRVVVPESSNGTTVRCGVFFRGKGDRLVYSGKTELSINLFTGSKFDPRMPERIGFVLTDR